MSAQSSSAVLLLLEAFLLHYQFLCSKAVLYHIFYCAQCVAKSTPKNAHESVLFDTIRLRASPWILIRIIGTLKVSMMCIDVHAGIMDVQYTNVSINLHA